MENDANPAFHIPHSTFRAREWTVLVLIATLFAVGTSILSWDNARTRDLVPRFHWPDETANALFASRVARGDALAVPEPRNIVSANLIHPRSVNVRADGALVPGSYLGLPLGYGFVGRAFGERAMLFMTPMLAAVGLLAFAVIVRRLSGTWIAMLSTLLLALHPSMWFFTATAFLPNVPFVALLLIGFAMGMSTRWWRLGIAGIAIGFALAMRTHELLWVLAIVLAVAWHQRPGVPALVSGAFGIAIPFIPVLALNAQLYGSPLTTGYALLQGGDAVPTEFVRSFLPVWLAAFIAPFGWRPVDALVRFWRYIVVPYPWFIALAAIGFTATVLSQFRTKLRKDFGAKSLTAAGTFALTVWLILFYGSWELADPLVRETNVLTISYVRYWLPVIVVLAAWAGMGMAWVLHRTRETVRMPVAVLFVFAIASTALTRVAGDPAEGLLRQREALAEHRSRTRAVIAETEPNAIIVSHRMDKVFFPERAVVHAADPPMSDETFAPRLRSLADAAPMYWYATDAPPISGFAFTPVETMPFGERLFRVSIR